MISTHRTHNSCIIIGAGLSGLTTAVRLQERGIDCLILEARDRIGGRILTHHANGGAYDLGPAWFWPHHTHVQQMMQTLSIASFPQFEQGNALYDAGVAQPPQQFRPPPMPVSYRFDGGVTALVDGLAQQLPSETIQLETAAQAIEQQADHVRVQTNRGVFSAEQIVCTLPPRLIVDSLQFAPPLPQVVQNEMAHTMTWMGQAMKVVLTYKTAFWREAGLSGLTISHAGPVAQFHDHSSADLTHAVLFGWIANHSPVRQLARPERRAAVIAQAIRLFGNAAANPTDYAECDWANEPFTTASSQSLNAAADHPQYGHPLLQTAQFDGRLHWAATEVSPVNGGYLDGAIFMGKRSAERVAQHLCS